MTPLFQVKLSLFSTRAFSKLHVLFYQTEHFKTYPTSVCICNKITNIYLKEILQSCDTGNKTVILIINEFQWKRLYWPGKNRCVMFY